MQFKVPLTPATLIRRYKRFLADIRLDDGHETVAHCANPGRMTGLARPGQRIWVERTEDPRKRLGFGWRLAGLADGHLACIDTGAANRIVAQALAAGQVPALEGYDVIRPEQRYGAGSRIDFLLQGAGRRDAFVEVKSVTLSRKPGLAEFPDSVTARGARHLAELAEMARSGHRAMLIYLVQRSDCDAACIAADIDPAYAAASVAARAAGVEILVHRSDITLSGIDFGPALPFQPAPASG